MLDKKFTDGLKNYLKNWPGTIRVAMRTVEIKVNPPFGFEEYSSKNSNFELILLDNDESIGEHHLSKVDIILTSADNYKDLHLSALSLHIRIPCIQAIEYTLATRVEMARQEFPLSIKLLKKLAWLYLNEIKVKRAIALATSIQANGMPAFERYGKRTKSLLYFDNRVLDQECVTDEDLEKRLNHLNLGFPIRLAFSGRLIKAKGADALISLSIRLREMGFYFQMHIFGAGELELPMKDLVQSHQLNDQVNFHGAVNFATELLPYLQNNIDLFICCHRQGDPSCTYLETYACGIPIAGFANEAHAGILKLQDVGWAVPMNDVEKLADLVVSLSNDRQSIISKSKKAIKFARANLFESIFKERMRHCLQFINQRDV